MSVIDILDKIEPISLSEMKSIRLMNRVDTKYISSRDKLERLLTETEFNYSIQEVNNCRMNAYETVYYDTPDLNMYIQHHNKVLNRQKIRTRLYVESNLAFIEVKNKSNKGRTSKIRIEIPQQDLSDFCQFADAETFVSENSKYPIEWLTPSLETFFRRITLVSNHKTERLTIDTDLRFKNFRTQQEVYMPDLMIIELKQAGYSQSDIKLILHDLHIRPKKISKYCMGIVFTDPTVKRNRFKPKLLYINKILNHTKIC